MVSQSFINSHFLLVLFLFVVMLFVSFVSFIFGIRQSFLDYSKSEGIDRFLYMYLSIIHICINICVLKIGYDFVILKCQI
jgi:succinate dehydrogenase hydrophobic anchor subunit